MLACGFLIYAFSTLESLFNLGVFAAFAIATAFLADVLLAPALMVLLQRAPRPSGPATGTSHMCRHRPWPGLHIERRRTSRACAQRDAVASLRHAWLYLYNLDNTAVLRRLIDFYAREHKAAMSHAAFNGQTPDEMYFGTGVAVVIDLAAARLRARQEQMKANRATACGMCAEGPAFGALQLRSTECRMP